MTRPARTQPLGALLVLAAAVLWGTSGAAQELGAPTAPPPAVATLRVLLGGALLVAVVATGPGRLSGLLAAPRRTPGATVAAAAAMAVFQIGYLGGIRLTGVAIGTLVAIGSAPVTAGLLDALRGRPPGRRWAAATLVTIAGTVLLVLPGDEAAVRPGGVALALAAGVAYAVYAAASKRILDAGVGPSPAMAVAFVGAGVLLLPVLFTADLGWAGSTEGALALVWLGPVTVGLGYALFARGLRRVEASSATTLTLAEPLTAAAVAVVVLGERVTGPALLGAALVAAGLVTAGRGRRAPNDELPPRRPGVAE